MNDSPDSPSPSGMIAQMSGLVEAFVEERPLVAISISILLGASSYAEPS
jgi:hypothetical protein